ncbi:hypothetical protein NHX12_021511, partial [Muraenolepis orangiensis]
MSSSPGPSRVSPASNGASSGLFEELWTRLRECHQNAIQELEAKVGKLKRERCLDAQRLEEYYSRNQQLKEQYKGLLDTVSHLEERLRTEVCDRCAVLQENFTTKQTELETSRQQYRSLIASLQSDKNRLGDENRRLSTELEELKASVAEPQRSTSPGPEDGMIPDSPVMPSSLPLASKLKRRRKCGDTTVRYAETPLPLSRSSMLLNGLDHELLGAPSRNHKKELVLVPDTCEMDTSQSPHFDRHLEEVITETCALELPARQVAAAAQVNLIHPSKCKLSSRPRLSASAHYPQSPLGESLSLLTHSKRPSGGGPPPRPKRNKVETCQEEAEEDLTLVAPEAASPDGPHATPPAHRLTKAGLYSGTPSDKGTRPAASHQLASHQLASRANQDVTTGIPSPDHAEIQPTVEPLWSMDPALALSMYYTQPMAAVKEEPASQREAADPDCTFVSHSLLQGQAPCNQDNKEDYNDDEEEGEDAEDEEEEEEAIPLGPFQKANDSMDNMFDVTAYGEYDSCDGTRFDQSQPAHEEAEEEKGSRYYADLPEEERQKKLSACSRHRFQYIPPSTPENFWEVAAAAQVNLIHPSKCKLSSRPRLSASAHYPQSPLGESLSLLTHSKRPSGGGPPPRPKRNKVETCQEEAEEDLTLVAPEAASPDAEIQPTVEPLWSMDPALALSMYYTQPMAAVKVAAAAQVNLIHPSKCKLSSRPRLSASAHYPQSPLGESLSLLTHSKRPSGGGPPPRPKRNKVETCQEEAEEDLTLVAPEAASPDAEIQPTVEPLWSMDPALALSMYYTQPMAAVKYYADLPEEERQKKLSACSRHRFQYIPPSTPENFWEVAAAAQVNLIHPSKCKLSSRPRLSASAHYPQSPLGESLSLLTHSKRPSGGGPPPRPKRNKVETCQEEAEEDLTLVAPEAASPDAEIQPTVEPLWSMDPALALSMYYTQPMAAVK